MEPVSVFFVVGGITLIVGAAVLGRSFWVLWHLVRWTRKRRNPVIVRPRRRGCDNPERGE